MKYLFTFIFLLVVFSKLIACQCSYPRLGDSYRFATSVISGKIIGVSTYEKDEALLRITMDVYEEFKGSGLKEFYIFDPEKADGMCNVYLHEDQEILVYLEKYENGLTMTGYCSRMFPLKYMDKYPLELEILRKIKENDLSYISRFTVDTYQNDFFSKLSRIESNGSIPKIGIFEVQLDRLNYWTDVNVIEGFQEDIDLKILKLIKESEWILDNYYSEGPIPILAKFFLVIENDYWQMSGSYMFYEYNFQ
ncbi:hypothetical protein J2X69_001800 [Algoriphagus sp. 4150]|uniref:hypothetical protein n=1 Tax=Algoriphagus sp. 4150 TaxID=2817756 RepID=UPI00286546F2|nr:hypothetical protein [Algoriphagus sp. 4150]MDR7129463.1 hypothetical protein [Algoriphagus sp. 4150]